MGYVTWISTFINVKIYIFYYYNFVSFMKIKILFSIGSSNPILHESHARHVIGAIFSIVGWVWLIFSGSDWVLILTCRFRVNMFYQKKVQTIVSNEKLYTILFVYEWIFAGLFFYIKCKMCTAMIVDFFNDFHNCIKL